MSHQIVQHGPQQGRASFVLSRVDLIERPWRMSQLLKGLFRQPPALRQTPELLESAAVGVVRQGEGTYKMAPDQNVRFGRRTGGASGFLPPTSDTARQRRTDQHCGNNSHSGGLSLPKNRRFSKPNQTLRSTRTRRPGFIRPCPDGVRPSNTGGRRSFGWG